MTTQTLSVLLIEDTPEFAELVHKWLSPKGDIAFSLNWADSLMQGLHSLTQGKVDVILLDLGLPDSKGYETFTTVRNYAPTVPVIVLSGGDSESLALRMVQKGPDVQVENPIHLLAHDPNPQRVQCILWTAPRPESVAEAEKVLFPYLVKNRSHRVLNDFVAPPGLYLREADIPLTGFRPIRTAALR